MSNDSNQISSIQIGLFGFLVDGQIMRNCYNKNDEFPLSSLNGQINSSSGMLNDNQQSTRDIATHNYAKNYSNFISTSLQKIK